MEDQVERRKRVEQKNMGLVYIIAIIFITLAITTYMLYSNKQEVRNLEGQRDVLIDQLANELYQKKRLEKKNDSILKFWDTYNPVPLSSDLETVH